MGVRALELLRQYRKTYDKMKDVKDNQQICMCYGDAMIMALMSRMSNRAGTYFNCTIEEFEARKFVQTKDGIILAKIKVKEHNWWRITNDAFYELACFVMFVRDVCQNLDGDNETKDRHLQKIHHIGEGAERTEKRRFAKDKMDSRKWRSPVDKKDKAPVPPLPDAICGEEEANQGNRIEGLAPSHTFS